MTMKSTCEKCKAVNSPQSVYCNKCGAYLPMSSLTEVPPAPATAYVHCPDCNTEQPLNNVNCIKCGERLPIPKTVEGLHFQSIDVPCPDCHHDNPVNAKNCKQCGRPSEYTLHGAEGAGQFAARPRPKPKPKFPPAAENVHRMDFSDCSPDTVESDPLNGFEEKVNDFAAASPARPKKAAKRAKKAAWRKPAAAHAAATSPSARQKRAVKNAKAQGIPVMPGKEDDYSKEVRNAIRAVEKLQKAADSRAEEAGKIGHSLGIVDERNRVKLNAEVKRAKALQKLPWTFAFSAAQAGIPKGDIEKFGHIALAIWERTTTSSSSPAIRCAFAAAKAAARLVK